MTPLIFLVCEREWVYKNTTLVVEQTSGSRLLYPMKMSLHWAKNILQKMSKVPNLSDGIRGADFPLTKCMANLWGPDQKDARGGKT